MQDPTGTFRRAVARPDDEVPLEVAALAIAGHADPGLDVDRWTGELDGLADGCGEPTLDGLRRHLFGTLGFAGNRSDYYDPANSFLDRVLERRTGIPISLAIVCLAVGRRLGVPLDGVGMPGHFLLRDRVDHDCFVDPFAGGRLLDRAACREAFHALHGPEVAFRDEYLAPVGAHAILGRVLANLRAIFAAHDDRRAVVWVLRLRTMLPGVPAAERGELAGALAATGAFGEAADLFDELAEGVAGAQADQLRQHAATLRARLN